LSGPVARSSWQPLNRQPSLPRDNRTPGHDCSLTHATTTAALTESLPRSSTRHARTQEQTQVTLSTPACALLQPEQRISSLPSPHRQPVHYRSTLGRPHRLVLAPSLLCSQLSQSPLLRRCHGRCPSSLLQCEQWRTGCQWKRRRCQGSGNADRIEVAGCVQQLPRVLEGVVHGRDVHQPGQVPVR
jgi:hypothetical protein